MIPKAQAAVVLAILSGALSFGTEPIPTAGRDWYVDCTDGHDGADGLSPGSAWRSAKAFSGHTFRPGDVIYFRRGSVCTGMLTPKGSGSATAPIRLDAYGTGPLPQIRAEPGEEAALKLFDQEYWTIEHLDFSGGQPHGIFVTGSRGVLHGIHIRDVVIHDVTGQPKNKETGLLVIAPGSERQHFDDVLIDGVTAFHTTQWAGIMVAGVPHGFPPESSRNTNVIIRNSIAYDVAGDGIVLFQVINGLIENSAAWLTGMQETETIGTPNAIWTWMCRNCTVRHDEAFLTDSPGVDGGAFDIDYGDDDNIVEGNYAHDTQGYCVAVFGAGWATRNSIVRNNVCVANGLSPRLARRQGAVFLDTWNNGTINGLEISGNQIYWNPSIEAAALVNTAAFEGNGKFENNTIHSCSPSIVRSNGALVFIGNSYLDCSPESPHDEQSLCLEAFVSADERGSKSRGQVTLLESVHRQFPQLQIEIFVRGRLSARSNLRYDWNTGDLSLVLDDAEIPASPTYPALALKTASGKLLWHHDGFTSPAELGLMLRSFLGHPQFAKLSSDQ